MIWRRIIAITAIVSGLAGCDVYDRDAVPAAATAESVAWTQCKTLNNQGTITTHKALIECYLSADKAFGHAIHLAFMDELFGRFAARMRRIGADADAGLISDAEAGSRIAAARNAFRNEISQLDAQYRTNQADLMGGAAALAQGYAAGMAARRQSTAGSLQSSPPSMPPQPQLAPNGQYVSGRGAPALCPDGSYVVGSCHLAPNGKYVGD